MVATLPELEDVDATSPRKHGDLRFREAQIAIGVLAERALMCMGACWHRGSTKQNRLAARPPFVVDQLLLVILCTESTGETLVESFPSDGKAE